MSTLSGKWFYIFYSMLIVMMLQNIPLKHLEGIKVFPIIIRSNLPRDLLRINLIGVYLSKRKLITNNLR